MQYSELKEATSKENAVNRARYAFSRSLGFTSKEAKRLQFCSEETIRRVAEERDSVLK
jgi:hypothetical protein